MLLEITNHMRATLSTLFIILASYIIHIPAANAQGRVEIWVEKRDMGKFIHGTFSKQVGVPPLELISFVSSVEPYQFGQGQEVYIRYYAPEDMYFFLSIAEKEVNKFYRLESKPDSLDKGTGAFGPIRVDGLLRRLYIPHHQLSVLLRVKSDVSLYVLPAAFTVRGIERNDPYYKALFRLGRNISRGKFAVYKGDFKGRSLAGIPKAQSGTIFRQPGGSVLQLSISKEKLKAYEGWVTVDIDLSEKGTTRHFPFRFYFYHK
jgi:hypothetical protein